MVGLSDYAQALGAAQQLVPNLRDIRTQELQQQALAQQPALIQAQTQRVQFETQQGLVEAQQKAERKTLFGNRLARLGEKPSPTDYRTMAVEFPEFHEALEGAAKGLDATNRQKLVTQLAPIQSLITNGQYDKAAASVKRHMDADVAAGGQIEETDQELYDELTSGDVKRQKGAGGMVYGLLTQLNPDTAAANLAKVASDRTHVVSSGGALVADDGTELYKADSKPEYRTIKNADGSESIVQVSGSEGGGQVSGGGGAGANSAPSGRTQFGWTPRTRNGGDNTDAAVDGKIGGMSSALGIGATTPFPSNLSNMDIARALTLSEGGKGSIADRNNNPGNLIDPKTGGYRKFPTKEAGLAAAAAQVARNRARGQNTIQTMVEGVPVGGRGGSARVPGERPTSGGARVVFTSQPSQSSGVDQATVDFYAQKVAAGGDLPQLGSGKESSAWRRAILSRAADIQSGRGISGGDSNLAQADVKANRSALLQAQKQYTSTVGFEDTFQRNVKEVLRLAPQGVGGSAPIFNRWIQSGRKNVSGDPAVSAFNVAVNTAANEYAKLASGASGGAVTSDSARHEAMEILNNAQTLPQLQASIKQMQIDGHNRVVALDTQIKRLRGNISGAGGGSRPAAPAAAPPGGRMVGTYQGRAVYQLPNGKRVVAQ